MRKSVLAAVAAIVALSLSLATSAEARRSTQSEEGPRNFWEDSSEPAPRRAARSSRNHREQRDDSGSVAESRRSSGVGPRPSAWCGWYMRTQRGGGPEMNLAANWRRYGSATGPQVGAVVVWNHHVGEISGKRHLLNCLKVEV